jgi:hypothetical protein
MEFTPLLISVLVLRSFIYFQITIIIKKMFSQHGDNPTLLLYRQRISTIYEGSPTLKKMDKAIYR